MPNQPRLNDLDLVTLRLLLAVIDEGNLAKAAARENISVSSISRRLAELEARAGVQLLHRHDRGVRPTAAALHILPRIRGSLGLLEQVVDDLSEFGSGARGLVRVHTHMTALAGRLPKVIENFLTQYPRVDIEVDELPTAGVLHSVRVGTCDIGLISGTVHAADLELSAWAHDELVVAMPADHVLAGHAALKLADLVVHPFIGMQRDSALLELYRREAAGGGFTLNERAHVTGFNAVLRLVDAKVGISIVPKVAAIPDTNMEITFRPLDEPWAHRPLLFAISRSAKPSIATQRFIECLV